MYKKENLEQTTPPETDTLNESFDDEEIELEPPVEENKAKKLNVNNVFLVIIIAVVFIISIVVIFSKISNGQKKEKESAVLDKAGSKYIPTIDLKDNSDDENSSRQPEQTNATNKDNVDKVIDELPEDFKQPEATLAPITTSKSGGGGSSYKSDRPDTRNSNSIRKIDGIAGQQQSNANLISNAVSGSKSPSSNQSINKNDYISNLLKQSSQVQSSYSGNQNQTAQTNKEDFYSNNSNNSGQGTWLSYSSLWDGTIITGALVTAINTDNPGVVIARVTENVYSSYDYSFLLIPEGSLLYATYNSSISYAQNRVQIAWNLLIRPDGFRMELGNMNGVDSTGQSGTKGFATSHPFETLKALGLVAMFSIIQTEITNDIKTTNNEYAQNAMNDVYSEASKLGNKIVDRALDIKPTITIQQGTQIKFITNTPIDLPPVQVNQVSRKYERY